MVKKQTFIKALSFLSAAIFVVAGFALKAESKSQKYLTMIENGYMSSFEQLNSSLNNISLALEKTAYANSSKKLSSLSSQIFSEAELAKSALLSLPIPQENLSTIYRFLSQVGNYALSVSKNVTNEKSISKDQRQKIKLLRDTAKTVTRVINDSEIEYNTPEHWAQSVEDRLNDTVNEESLATALTQLEEDLSDYPTLIYDGPYSDHILDKEPLMTANAKLFSESEALSVAQKISQKNSLKFESMQNGKIECYRFVDNNTTVAISKLGGYVVYMRKNREIGETLLSYEQALSKAKNFLAENDITSMVDTYYYTDEGICVINFAYLDGQTICYTDLIKVGVAMDTGEIMLLESSGYLTNHTERAFVSANHTQQQAMERINEELEIEKIAMSLVPTDSGGEVRCYEFLCKGEDNQEILVYINVQTLEEEQIYVLLKTDGGTLVK